MTLVIWAIEAGVWMSVGAAVGFGMTPIEGLYLVALASVFSAASAGVIAPVTISWHYEDEEAAPRLVTAYPTL